MGNLNETLPWEIKTAIQNQLNILKIKIMSWEIKEE